MKKLPLVLAALICASAGFAQTRAYVLTDGEKKEMDAALVDEAAVYAESGEPMYSFWPKAKSVSAAEMRDVYASNQIDGEQRYKGKYVRIYGVITGFHSGIGDEPSVTLGDSNRLFGNPTAKFSKDKSAALANLRKGQKIAFFCTAAGVVVGTPFLRDCKFQDEVQAEALPILKTRMDAFLTAKIADAEMAKTFRLIRFSAWPIKSPQLCAKRAVSTCTMSESLMYGTGKKSQIKGVDYASIKVKILMDADDSTRRILTTLYDSKFANAVVPDDDSDQRIREAVKNVVY